MVQYSICAFPYISGSPYMTLHPIYSEFLYIWGKFHFLFYHCSFHRSRQAIGNVDEWNPFRPKVKYGVWSPKFIWASVYSCSHWQIPRNPPSPPHLGSNTRALLVSQDRRHLFVTPCLPASAISQPIGSNDDKKCLVLPVTLSFPGNKNMVPIHEIPCQISVIIYLLFLSQVQTFLEII